jgi:HD superfamily phosphohydrolase YqeK
VDTIELPAWARAGAARRAHIARVTALLLRWADAMQLTEEERSSWRDAGRWHDALRDAPERELRVLVPDLQLPTGVLHGPAAARRLERNGETRAEVVEAVRWHTIGCADWARTGDALYMADFLEPGRSFDPARRKALAESVPEDFSGTLREVVRWRIARAVERDRPVHAETSRYWERVR